uniref:Uncharacterized protein n=1 Tax=Aegilops tauschii subsp. strangulata TaxID=200361 RepID=A0A453PG56_AEGTS
MTEFNRYEVKILSTLLCICCVLLYGHLSKVLHDFFLKIKTQIRIQS